jgi:hypothetical protein
MGRRVDLRAVAVGVVVVALLSGCSAARPVVAERSPQPTPSSARPTTSAAVTDFPDDSAGGDAIDDDTLVVLGIYPVNGDAIIPTADPAAAAVWRRFTQLFPARLHPEITLFVAIDGAKSDGTQGAMQLNALHPGKQYLALDTLGFDTPNELDRTMIHEFAHLLTLRESQMPLNSAAARTCDVYTDDSGCPARGSYLRAYLARFWPGSEVGTLDESDSAVTARYRTGGFVTEYAATNPFEDMAEVFTEWVVASAPAKGTAQVDQKLRFFDAYPEVVAIRDIVRASL